MNKLVSFILTALLLAPLSALHGAELKLATVFSDHMVLQRDAAVPVWGMAAPGESVTVEFARISPAFTPAAIYRALFAHDQAKLDNCFNWLRADAYNLSHADCLNYKLNCI